MVAKSLLVGTWVVCPCWENPRVFVGFIILWGKPGNRPIDYWFPDDPSRFPSVTADCAFALCRTCTIRYSLLQPILSSAPGSSKMMVSNAIDRGSLERHCCDSIHIHMHLHRGLHYMYANEKKLNSSNHNGFHPQCGSRCSRRWDTTVGLCGRHIVVIIAAVIRCGNTITITQYQQSHASSPQL